MDNYGARLEHRTSRGNGLLHLACEGGALDVAQLLLDEYQYVTRGGGYLYPRGDSVGAPLVCRVLDSCLAWFVTGSAFYPSSRVLFF